MQMAESGGASNNGRSSRRKPSKTTRILAEIDDDTSGTESFYVNDASASGLEEHDQLQYEPGDSEYCPLLTECDDEEFEHNQTVSSDTPEVTVISSSSSESVSVTASSKVCSHRGRPPQQVHLNVHDESDLLPIDEDSVGPVLEKLLAMMQSMSMLLSALKTDLRHSTLPDVQAKKRDAAITQLWRALVAYQKSFSEIEQFARSSKSEQFACSSTTGGQAATKSSDESSQSHVKAVKNTTRGSAPSETPDIIELSESDTESDEGTEVKRPRYDVTETVKLTESTPVSNAAEEVTDTLVESDSSYVPSASASTSDVSFDVATSGDEVWGMQSEGEPIVEFQAA